MLQPLQLEEVSKHYAADIAELREFLAKARVPVQAVDSLDEMVARLREDREFRRDATSHVWVLMDRCHRATDGDGQISTSDLLGILALAAAGPQFAAAAGDDAAHDLLRFVMEARRQMEAAPENLPRTTGPTEDAGPGRGPEAVRANAVSTRVAQGDAGDRRDPGDVAPLPARITGPERRHTVWLAAACVMAVLSGGLWWHHRAAKTDSTRVTTMPAPAVAAVQAEPVGREDFRVVVRPEVPTPLEHPAETKAMPQRMHVAGPQSVPSRPSVASRLPVPPRWTREPAAAPAREGASAAEAVKLSSNTGVAGGTHGSPPTTALPAAARATGPSLTLPWASPSADQPRRVTPVPAAVLSSQLGARRLPLYATAEGGDGAVAGQRVPRLLRRNPPVLSGDASTLLAEVEPTEMPNVFGAGRVSSGNATAQGIVRPASLGIMAGNVLYSPAPAYPAAASASHVQGEVRVQAEVDRDGNVAFARVISGPPLLRDAALDAVQHWRYRPYLLSGKTVAMSTTAIVEFELP